MMTGVCGHQARLLSNPLNLGFRKSSKIEKNPNHLSAGHIVPFVRTYLILHKIDTLDPGGLPNRLVGLY